MTKAERDLLLLMATLLLHWLSQNEQVIDALDLEKAMTDVESEGK